MPVSEANAAKVQELQAQRRKFVMLMNGEFARRWGERAKVEIDKIDEQLRALGVECPGDTAYKVGA